MPWRNFGAKKGGVTVVASKFSNDLIVVDPIRTTTGTRRCDHRGPHSACLGPNADVPTDDDVTAYAGMGGQGVLPIPLVYNGWVQKLPQSWKNLLTTKQRNPIQ